MSGDPAVLRHADPHCLALRPGDLAHAEPPVSSSTPCPCACTPRPLALTPLLRALAVEFRLEHAARLRGHVREAAGEVSAADTRALEELCASRRLPARRAALVRQLSSHDPSTLPHELTQVLAAGASHLSAAPPLTLPELADALLTAAGLRRDAPVPARLGPSELQQAAAQVLTELAFERDRLDLRALDVALQQLCGIIEACWARDALRPDEVVLLRSLAPGTHLPLRAPALALGEILPLDASWGAVRLPGILVDELTARALQLRGTGVFRAGVVENWREVVPVGFRLWLDAEGDRHEDTPPWSPGPEGLAVLAEALEAARLLCTP